MPYKLSKTDGGSIDPTEAKNWMNRYDQKNPGAVRAYFYGSDIIRKIIDNPEAVGMRIYFAYGENDKSQLVLIGSREDGSNIWPEGFDGKDGPGGGTVADSGIPCPPYC